MAKTITTNEYYQLIGLKAVATDLNKQLEAVHKAAKAITGEVGDEHGHTADFIYDSDTSVADLLERLKIVVHDPE